MGYIKYKDSYINMGLVRSFKPLRREIRNEWKVVGVTLHYEDGQSALLSGVNAFDKLVEWANQRNTGILDLTPSRDEPVQPMDDDPLSF